MTRSRRYYGTQFKGHQYVTHEDPLPPTIFNTVVYELIYHYIMMVAGEEEGTDGFGRAVQWLAALFYAADGLLASLSTACLQAALDILAGLFERVGLHTNPKERLGWCFNLFILLAETCRRHIHGG